MSLKKTVSKMKKHSCAQDEREEQINDTIDKQRELWHRYAIFHMEQDDKRWAPFQPDRLFNNIHVSMGLEVRLEEGRRS